MERRGKTGNATCLTVCLSVSPDPLFSFSLTKPLIDDSYDSASHCVLVDYSSQWRHQSTNLTDGAHHQTDVTCFCHRGHRRMLHESKKRKTNCLRSCFTCRRMWLTLGLCVFRLVSDIKMLTQTESFFTKDLWRSLLPVVNIHAEAEISQTLNKDRSCSIGLGRPDFLWEFASATFDDHSECSVFHRTRITVVEPIEEWIMRRLVLRQCSRKWLIRGIILRICFQSNIIVALRNNSAQKCNPDSCGWMCLLTDGDLLSSLAERGKDDDLFDILASISKLARDLGALSSRSFFSISVKWLSQDLSISSSVTLLSSLINANNWKNTKKVIVWLASLRSLWQ